MLGMVYFMDKLNLLANNNYYFYFSWSYFYYSAGYSFCKLIGLLKADELKSGLAIG